MIIKDRTFIPVLLGSDINTYSVARAFHEAYQVRSIVVGKSENSPSAHSKIIDFKTVPNTDQEKTFLEVVAEISKKYSDKKVILIGCGDSYVSLISKNKKVLPPNVIAPYIDHTMMLGLIKKERFYEMCQKNGLAYPKTFIHRKEKGSTYTLPFGFPVILKPSNSVLYWEHPFNNQKKVYKLKNRFELDETMQKIYAAGYDDSLIIQDFIPGDDSYMRVLTCYSDKNKKVKLMSLGHVLLEEHTPHGLGNHAVIINETNDALVSKIKSFLESIGYIGFSNFDIKYDTRDNTYRIFELNARQGRSNYYVTAAGGNIARCLVEDYIENKELPVEILKNKKLWLVIPRRVAFSYVKSKESREEMRALIKKSAVVNPLFYKTDYSPKRLLYLIKSHLSHFIKYKKYHE